MKTAALDIEWRGGKLTSKSIRTQTFVEFWKTPVVEEETFSDKRREVKLGRENASLRKSLHSTRCSIYQMYQENARIEK